MKRLASTPTPSPLPTVRLYRQDLDEIVRLLSEMGSVRIEHDGYLLESLDELQKEFGNEVAELKLSASGKSAPTVGRVDSRSDPSTRWLQAMWVERSISCSARGLADSVMCQLGKRGSWYQKPVLAL
jgi:hypothetical protein